MNIKMMSRIALATLICGASSAVATSSVGPATAMSTPLACCFDVTFPPFSLMVCVVPRRRLARRCLLAGAADHPVALNFPEGEYLKGLLVQVD